MARSYSSLNFDGQMRVDANHGMNPQYAPNSFIHQFRPDTAEAPYQLSDSIMSRKSHFSHEGSPSEYYQPRMLYEKFMDDKARDHLHKTTAMALKLVNSSIIQKKYLARFLRVSRAYAEEVYALLPEKNFGSEEVEEASRVAETAGKEPKFCPHLETDKLVGKCPAMQIYNQWLARHWALQPG
ncbi:Catalase [Penicillium diatomitis]|uniref:Catalase n=1 Tax=Penicillium diatomitis TaxID=2819901 RepID=A0A9W9XFK8_9EURO|nr:Catalase [Penicillium diatomitis]KAJ5491028.1 Catalase [Penicillium diatomitis]